LQSKNLYTRGRLQKIFSLRGFRGLQEWAGPLFKLFALKGGGALGASAVVMSLNKKAFDALHEPKALEIVPLGHWSVLSSMP
jgi:hypothetical protein